MDEKERYQVGDFYTPQEAISLCKEIIEASIQYEVRKSPPEYFYMYFMFDDGPYIM
ncbi:MAG: hypothetical protein HPY57_01595 [Ignavibacteria bacterium]|nr:hypothetical protein [Ignavibacteria bacterium]